MKKILGILLAIVMTAALLGVTVSAEPENKLKSSWGTTLFGGALKKSTEGGISVYTYTPESAYGWISPEISIFKTVKELIGPDDDGVEIVFSFEVRGVFKEAGGYATGRSMLRAISPVGKKTYDFREGADPEWLANWNNAYGEATEGEKIFALQPESGNNMAFMQPDTVEIKENEWTLYESDPVYVAASNINTELFGDWVWCMDQITYGDSGLKSIQFRNAAIYLYDDWAEANATPEPTSTPTPEPTDPPEATDVPTDTVTDAPEATDTATDGTQTTEGNDPTVLIVGIICGVVVVAAIVTAIIVKKKRGKQ